MVKNSKIYLILIFFCLIILNPIEIKAEESLNPQTNEAKEFIDYINVTATVEVDSTIIPYHAMKETSENNLKVVPVIYSKDSWINDVIALALTKIGCPYSQARREAENTYDCSSFVRRMYQEITGVYIGHNTRDMYANMAGKFEVGFDEIESGDLLWLSGHIGLYFEDEDGNPKVVHATGYGDVVKVEDAFGRIGWTHVFRPINYIKYLIGEEY